VRLRRLEKAITEIIITNIVSFFLNDIVLKLFFFFFFFTSWVFSVCTSVCVRFCSTSLWIFNLFHNDS